MNQKKRPYFTPTGNDVCFLVEGEKFYSQKKLLSSESEFFSSMFNVDWNFKEAKYQIENPIPLPNISSAMFQALLHYVHCKKIILTLVEDRWELSSYSQYFGMENLSIACQQSIGNKLSDDTVCFVWNRASRTGASTLCNCCKTYFMENFSSIVHSPGFVVLHRALLKEGLQSGNINGQFKVVLRAVRSWAWFNMVVIDKSPYTEEALQNYILDLLPPNTLFCLENKLTALQCYRVPFSVYV